MGVPTAERSTTLFRPLLHVAGGLVAFSVCLLGPFLSILGALLTVAFAIEIFPHLGGRRLWRPDERQRGASSAMVLYALVVALLLTLLHRRIEIATAAWGILAFGDGTASLLGNRLGRRTLPWNRHKTWVGTTAFWIFGTIGSVSLLLWTQPNRYDLGVALAACAAVALLAALLESAFDRIDDNFWVPLVSAGLLYAALSHEAGHPPAYLSEFGLGLVFGLAVNFALAGAAYQVGVLGFTALTVGSLLGAVIWASMGWRGYILLLAFIVIGTISTHWGYNRKRKIGLAEPNLGKRRPTQILAKLLIPALCALAFAVATDPLRQILAVAFAASLATVTADTLSSEIGQLSRRPAILSTTLRVVPTGTDGAISIFGSVASVLAAFFMAWTGYVLVLYPMTAIPIVALSAIAANLAESLIGAGLERTGHMYHDEVNLTAAAIGAVIAIVLMAALTS